ncbi:TetR family transcriptional regulator [Streptomyces camponoticapitis]|uniref:TetR family transcriptional regulator n=1 Tax=Streptomyces camponoticapitis TaxID=1616125 RepID=A0ABQ2EBT0_9ACTN|nr:TetR/AcrR family transcriptional regulator C-terminal domain-containing protein [Streptomyces camponoticapitis]GGK00918.1 TetR family transcriptional regulator [Streptomyces camponoticapitis]
MSKPRFLTPDLIALTALELGDRAGEKAMTMRRIASELGCDPMALYRHFRSRELLLDAVADLAIADAADPDPDLVWDERITATAHAIRGSALRHPGISAHIASRPPMGENGRRLGAAMLTALDEAGLSPVTAVRSVQTLVAYLASSLAMAVRAGVRDQRWEEVSDVISELPETEAPGEELFVVGSAEQFRFGLRLLLAGIKAEAVAESDANEKRKGKATGPR